MNSEQLCESVCLKMDEELVDDVFEDDLYNPKNYYRNTNTGLSFSEATFLTEQTPSPTGIHPGFRTTNTKLPNGDNDGWKSFKIVDDNAFDENTLHKVSEGPAGTAAFFRFFWKGNIELFL